MAGFIISNKLTTKEAADAIRDIAAWFEAHPTRLICRTGLGWKVRRHHIADDVNAHAELRIECEPRQESGGL